MRSAVCGEVALRIMSVNQRHCSAVPPGTISDVKTWRNAGSSVPQPCSISSSITRAFSAVAADPSRRKRPRQKPPQRTRWLTRSG